MAKMIDPSTPFLISSRLEDEFRDCVARGKTNEVISSINNLDNELQRRAAEIRQLKAENERLKQDNKRANIYVTRWFWLTDGKRGDRIRNHVVDHVEIQGFGTLEEYVDFKLNERN